jgi:hypothetical protein
MISSIRFVFIFCMSFMIGICFMLEQGIDSELL